MVRRERVRTSAGEEPAFVFARPRLRPWAPRLAVDEQRRAAPLTRRLDHAPEPSALVITSDQQSPRESMVAPQPPERSGGAATYSTPSTRMMFVSDAPRRRGLIAS